MASLLVVSIGELLPGESAPMRALSALDVSDKILHFGAYFILAFIPVFGLRSVYGWVCVLLSALAGVALEVLQSLVPGRSFDSVDLAANLVGLVAGAAIAVTAIAWWRRNIRS
jgi:VanZ family protein